MFRRWANHDRMDIRHTARSQPKQQAIMGPLLRNLETRRRLIEANREDLAVYTHVVESVFPRQLAAYGPRLEGDVEIFLAFNQPNAGPIRSMGFGLYRRLVLTPGIRWCLDATDPHPATLAPSTDRSPASRKAA